MRTVLISGCSSGFGASCVREFAAAGDRVIATMRNPDASVALDADIRAMDVTDAASVDACVSSVIADYGGIDVLVNNAGIHLLGAVEDMDSEALRVLFETNFFGALNLARAVLPHMRARGGGHIVTVSSIGSRIGRVADGIYCASKAAVEIAFEAMKHEVERFGVHVSVVCPSAFRTNIGQNFRMPANYADSPYRDLVAFRLGKVREACAVGGDPADVARLIKAIADDPDPGFRYIVGDKAAEIDRAMTGLNDGERADLIAKLAGIGWWRSGLDASEEGPNMTSRAAQSLQDPRRPVIEIAGLNKWYDAYHVLKDVDLIVRPGEKVVICGPSGSGKSTLIRCINCLENHQSGSLAIDGKAIGTTRDIHALRQTVGMVFQQFNLFPHLTVLDNLILAPRIVRKAARAAAMERALYYLDKVKLAGSAAKYPAQLSGGQQQRVAIARALCMEPSIMLFDEPTSALDPETIGEVLETMIELAESGMTMLCVTHEMAFARRVANRVIFMDEGRILEDRSPDLFFDKPDTDRLKRFLSQILPH